MLGDCANSCDKMMVGGKSSRQGRTAVAVLLPLDPLDRVVEEAAAGFFTLGLGGLKPVTAVTGCRTAPPLLPAVRWATWKMLTAGVETRVTGSASESAFLTDPPELPEDGAAVISKLLVNCCGGSSLPVAVEDVVALLASSCGCYCSCRRSPTALPLLLLPLFPSVLAGSPLDVARRLLTGGLGSWTMCTAVAVGLT